MVGFFRSLTTRHEDKMKPALRPGEILRPGSEADKRLPLSYKGQMNAFQTGTNPQIVPVGYDLVLVDRSDLVRTTMTAQQMLAGAGYNPDGRNERSEVLWNPEDPRIGLANGMAFDHPELPKYDPNNADGYVTAILRDFWLPKADAPTRPAVAKVAYALLDNQIKAIEQAMLEVRKGAKVFHVQATHAPLIDSLDAALFGTVRVDGGQVKFNEASFPSNYAMGTFIRGESTPDGLISYQGKDHEGSQRLKNVSLDEMKILRDHLYKVSEVN